MATRGLAPTRPLDPRCLASSAFAREYSGLQAPTCGRKSYFPDADSMNGFHYLGNTAAPYSFICRLELLIDSVAGILGQERKRHLSIPCVLNDVKEWNNNYGRQAANLICVCLSNGDWVSENTVRVRYDSFTEPADFCKAAFSSG